MRTTRLTALVFAVLAVALPAQVPELLYHSFDEGGGPSTANLASPGVGAASATVNGHLMTAVGQFATALVGVGGSSGNNFVDPGWGTNLGMGDWTIGFWLDTSASTSNPSLTFMYLFGDAGAGAFRCFADTPGGADRVRLRGPFTSVTIPGATGPSHVCFVYDSVVPEIRGYLNGVLVTTVAQAPISIVGSQFKIGGYSTGAALAQGALMDEFRVYSRALTATEITNTWNSQLSGPAPVLYQVNQPGATMDVNGAQGTAYTLATVNASTNSLIGLNLTSTLQGMPWDLAYGIAPVVTAGSGAASTAGGQLFNIDLTDPTWTTWFGVFANSQPFVDMTFPLAFTSPLTISGQFAVMDPTTADGFVLSQPTRANVQ